MKRSTLLLVLLCSSVPVGLTRGSEKSILASSPQLRSDAQSLAIDNYVVSKMRSSRIPGLTLGIVKGDQISYMKGYGTADRSGRAVTPQTPFVIGSITKAFTALAVMQLVEAGEVTLDAPVRRYIPWFQVADPRASQQITVRHLLSMTSGLPQLYDIQQWTEQDDGAIERAVRILQTEELSRPLGSFGYSNSNYETLGLIVQIVSGMSYEKYVTQHIFAPLDMHDSFLSQDEAVQDGMASGHRWWFGIPIPVTMPYNRAELPAGYIQSSAEDMSHFLIAQMNGGRYRQTSVLSPDGIALTHTEPAPRTYGFGWELVETGGRTLINLDGGTASFQSSLFFDPGARVGVFMAANVVNALDALSSPPGSTPLDGLTVRAMALSVLSLATNRPMPSQGLGHERLTLIFDLVILAMTVALVISVARIPGRHTRLVRQGIPSRASLVRRSSMSAIVNFSWPIVVLSLVLGVPAWPVVVQFQPDLVYWLYAVATVLLLKGVFELAFAWHVFETTRSRDHVTG